MTVIDVQLSPANTDWATLRAATLVAERRGYGAAFVFDHLAGVALGGSTMLDSFALLGALTEITTQIELGTMVANVWNRQVGTLVSAAASVAIMSGRQFHLGIGAGTSPVSNWAIEQHAVDAHLEPSLATRHGRVQQVLDLAAAQWAPDRDERFATFPSPTPPPSRIVGVNSVRLSRIAGAARRRHQRARGGIPAATSSLRPQTNRRVGDASYAPPTRPTDASCSIPAIPNGWR